MKRPKKKNLGIGVGLREDYYPVFLREDFTPAQWIEVNSEKYLKTDDGQFGAHLQVLRLVREKMPVVLHGTSMSLASVGDDNTAYLKKFAELIKIIQPEFVSDHICWCGTDGISLYDLLPVPFNQESIDVIVQRITSAQDFLKRHILVENLSTYIELESSDMSEWDFISEIARRADCYLLLDINNVYVSSQNHGWDPYEFMKNIPHDRVYQIHLAGHFNRGDIRIDTHAEFIVDPVWDMYRWFIKQYGPVSTMIEWDKNFPDWPILAAELRKIEYILNEDRQKCA